MGNLRVSVRLTVRTGRAAVIGQPVSDLAFLTTRSTPSGATVPPDLVAAYLERRPQDRCELQLALLADQTRMHARPAHRPDAQDRHGRQRAPGRGQEPP